MGTPHRNDDAHGRFLGVPYDWRKPTLERFKSRVWNDNDDRIVVPRWYGWGYDVNFHALSKRVRPRRRG
jgi:hypothetical protein